MKRLNEILADLIRDGDVTIRIPGIDEEELENILNHEMYGLMQQMRDVLDCDDWTNGEKVAMIRSYLEEW